MYIIEKLIQAYLRYTNKEILINVPNDDENIELEDVLTCEHNFMPIDSTGKILACSKCGYLIDKKRLNRKKNFNKKN